MYMFIHIFPHNLCNIRKIRLMISHSLAKRISIHYNNK